LKRHRSAPVAASSANTRPSGVTTYIVPSTTSGVASSDTRRLPVAHRGAASPVRKRHATRRRPTFSRVTCASGDERAPPGSRP
jgi:siroheme synthase